MRIYVDENSLIRVQDAIAALAQETEDPSLLEDIATQSVYPAVADIFDNEGYGAWGGLSPEYAAWKERNGGGPLLELTGALRTSLTQEGAPGNVHQFDETGNLIIGSDLPYFAAVDAQRPIAQVQQQHFDSMAAIAAAHIAGKAESLGFEVTAG